LGIRVVDLVKDFGKVRALDGISFSCEEGEVFGLLGPNGAGKTTTIRLILGILSPTSGEVFIDGKRIWDDPFGMRKRVGALLEENGIYDRLTARENIELFAKFYGLSKEDTERKIEELSELLDMSNFLDRQGKEFSKGMRQKVALARALVSDPHILILDEPTEGLDVPTRRTILDLIKREKEKGRCILYSTHVMSEAQEVCDRLGILYEGRLHFVGTIGDILKNTDSSSLEEAFLKVVHFKQKEI
jgi:sodium transport system ATP-binding protein